MPRPHLSTPERVQAAIDRNAPNGCWVWSGAVEGTGAIYGSGRKRVNVRRLVWEQAGRALEAAERLFVQCGNARCVNPDHAVRQPARVCPICSRADLADIDRALAQRMENGQRFSDIAVRFGVTVHSVKHHWRSHVHEGRSAIISGRRDVVVVKGRAERERAVEWLRERLADGPEVGRTVRREGEAAGITRRHMDFAYRALDVRFTKRGDNGQRIYTKGVHVHNIWRLPTAEEVAALKGNVVTTTRHYRSNRADVSQVVKDHFVRRDSQWIKPATIKSWVGKDNHARALEHVEELHRRDWLEKLVSQTGEVIAYRRVAPSVMDALRPQRVGPVVHIQTHRANGEPTVAQITEMADIIYEVLRTRGRMSKNDLHNYLGSSRRGSAKVFNAALDKLVADGRVRRTTEGRTAYYEVVGSNVPVT